MSINYQALPEEGEAGVVHQQLHALSHLHLLTQPLPLRHLGVAGRRNVMIKSAHEREKLPAACKQRSAQSGASMPRPPGPHLGLVGAAGRLVHGLDQDLQTGQGRKGVAARSAYTHPTPFCPANCLLNSPSAPAPPSPCPRPAPPHHPSPQLKLLSPAQSWPWSSGRRGPGRRGSR